MDDLLKTQLARSAEVRDSALALLRGVKAGLDAAGADPDKLAELRGQLEQIIGDLEAVFAEETQVRLQTPPALDSDQSASLV